MIMNLYSVYLLPVVTVVDLTHGVANETQKNTNPESLRSVFALYSHRPQSDTTSAK